MALAYYDDQNNSGANLPSIAEGSSKILAICLGVLAIAIAMMFLTYSINDPSPLNSNDNVPNNALGAMGAWFADPLLMGLGRGVWVLPIAFMAWSIRGLLGHSMRNLISRLIFLPIALVIWSAFTATHSLTVDWPFYGEYGMGGDIGDKLLGGIIAMLPFGLGFSLFFASITLAFLAIMIGCFVSGISFSEIRGFIGKIVSDAKWCILQILLMVQAFQNKRVSRPKRAQATAPKMAAKGAPIAQARGETASATLSLKSLFGNTNKSRAGRYVKQKERHANENAATASIFAAPHAEPRNISERIQNIVSKNVAQHNTLIKRSINSEERAAPDFDTDTALGRMVETDDMVEPFINPEEQEYAPMDHDAFENEMMEAPEHIPAPRMSLGSAPLVQNSTAAPKMSQRAAREAQPKFEFDASNEQEFEMPPLSLLQSPDTITRYVPPREALEASARQLESVLADYGVQGEVIAVRPGPVVTMYELEPAAGLKASRVIGLADDIARSMSALTARVATIPGRSVIGIELPNETREMVLLREIFAAKNYGDSKLPLPLALGKDIAGEPIVTNLAKMPHLLIAGTTGSGKSVAINTMILSLLYHASPDDVRMIMIDPKMLELSVYDDIPHLLSPVVTDPKKAVVALKWVVSEMEERYRKMSKMGVRNIDGYNDRVKSSVEKGEAFIRTVQTGFDDLTGEPVFETEEYAPEKMPYIVVIVDEMADLMMVAGKEIEACIQRLAQMARASGIHLIMATQRPSVDVITGTIKANFPTRISFQVTSKIDSRTILGEMGAEQLLGMGDMLYMASGGRVTRVHGPFVSDQEVEEVVRHLKAQGEPKYHSGVVEGPEDDKASSIDEVLGLGSGDNGEDALYDQAVMIVARDRKCSTSYIQRKLSIGYNKAAKIVERMEEQNVVSQANHVGKREILVPEMN